LVWSKNEGLLYAATLLLGAVSVRLRASRPALLWLALPLALVAFTWISNAVFGFRNDLATMRASGGLERLGEVLGHLFGRVYTSSGWWDREMSELAGNWLYPLFFLLVLLAPRAAFSPARRLITTTLLAIAVMHLLVYVYTPHQLPWHLGESAQRVVWQTLPAVALWLSRVGVGRCGSLWPSTG
jgi:hypothetical protein